MEAALSRDDLTEAQRAQLVGELGLCELGLRKYRDAAEHLQQNLDHRNANPTAFGEEVAAALLRAVEHVGQVFYSQSPPDAAVLLDGRPLGRLIGVRVFFLEPGQHAIRARMDGYKDVLQTFEIAKGQSTILSMELPRIPDAPGRIAESAPEKPRATRPARVPQTTVATAAPQGSTLITAGWFLAGGTALVGGASLVWAEFVRGDREELSATLRRDGWLPNTCSPPETPQLPVCSELRDLREKRAALNTAGIVTLATSGVIGMATLAATLFSGKTTNHAGIHVEPVVTGQVAGLWMNGSW